MKIWSNNFLNLQSTAGLSQKTLQADNKSVSAPKKNFDEILISTKTGSVVSDRFAAEISGKISSELRTGASDAKLEDLKNQIQNGTYTVDLDEIAKKMVFVQ